MRKVIGLLAALAVLAGLSLVSASVVAPEATERVEGTVSMTVDRFVERAKGHKYPRVALGVVGGKRQLDRCDGTFTHMKSYEMPGLAPVWVAHNTCGGDVILHSKAGSIIDIKGVGLHRVVDATTTTKTWRRLDQIAGLGGDFILQTCFYGQNKMLFLGLEPIKSVD